jgi:hypothetical protein
MADEKVTRLEIIRRHVELRDLALAASYPQTRSITSLSPTTSDKQSLRKRQRVDPNPPENVAKPWKKPWDE